MTQKTAAGLPVEEPIAHHLLREAKSLYGANPRSALLIAVAAVEVGLKTLIAELVPAASWLVEETPSPPISKIIGEYLEQLPCRIRIHDRVIAPPKPWRNQIADAVKARNALAHGGRFVLSLPELEKILSAVENVLYLLDYYTGHAWAWDLLDEDFRQALLSA
jgi:hypothetical protein